KNSGKTPCRSTLFYPLINQPELPFPDSIWVSDRNAQQTLDFKTTEKGVYFEIQIPSHAQRTYRVGYRQQTPAQKMEYILTTTHRWHRPLEQATFAIKIPQHLSLSELSFPYDQMTEDSSEDREGRYII
ncbi:MAG: hypothetical protein GWN62_37215, partial [Aliifodinibius sp.]|nr:hypothetical protein [Fodinibius sp.]